MNNYGKTRKCTEYRDEFAMHKGRHIDEKAVKNGFYRPRRPRSASDSPRRKIMTQKSKQLEPQKSRRDKEVLSVSPSHGKDDKKFYKKALKKYFKDRNGLFPAFKHMSHHDLEALYFEIMA